MEEPINEVRLLLDRAARPLGAVVITDSGGPAERVHPFDVGPFDSPDEVLTEGLKRLTVQLTLW